jgi:hypothetical protein
MKNLDGRGRGYSRATASLGMPQVVISEHMFRQTGENDYGAAMRTIDDQLGLSGRRAVSVVHEGMWGGFLAIRTAKAFLQREVMSAPGVVTFLDSLGLTSDGALVAAVHVRRGDFASDTPGPGQFNDALPLDWYVKTAEQIVEAANGQPLRLLVASNADRDQLGPLLRLAHTELVTRSAGESGRAIHDLAAMMNARFARLLDIKFFDARGVPVRSILRLVSGPIGCGRARAQFVGA